LKSGKATCAFTWAFAGHDQVQAVYSGYRQVGSSSGALRQIVW
jgi:hypothetical protein